MFDHHERCGLLSSFRRRPVSSTIPYLKPNMSLFLIIIVDSKIQAIDVDGFHDCASSF